MRSPERIELTAAICALRKARGLVRMYGNSRKSTYDSARESAWTALDRWKNRPRPIMADRDAIYARVQTVTSILCRQYPGQADAVASALLNGSVNLMASAGMPHQQIADALRAVADQIAPPTSNVIPIRRHLALVDSVQPPCDAPEGAA